VVDVVVVVDDDDRCDTHSLFSFSHHPPPPTTNQSPLHQPKPTNQNPPTNFTNQLHQTTVGVHFPESRFYRRRVRMTHNSWIVKRLAEAGYDIEPAVDDPDRTVVVT
jgi:hypothetical protein